MILARLAYLPDTSALAASIRDEPRGWGADRHLRATTIDALQNNSWITAAVGSGRKPRKPKPIPRPSDMKKRTVVSVADLVQREPGGR